MSTERQCEVCGRKWKCCSSKAWIVICPSCKTSGYHEPKAALEGEEMGILSGINGPILMIAGFVLGAVAAVLSRDIVFGVMIALALLAWEVGPLVLKNTPFNMFADAKYWPTFVLLGIADVFLSHGRLERAAIWTILDGMYFAQNY